MEKESSGERWGGAFLWTKKTKEGKCGRREIGGKSYGAGARSDSKPGIKQRKSRKSFAGPLIRKNIANVETNREKG